MDGVVGFVISVIAFNIVKTRLRKQDVFCDIKIFLYENYVKTKAIIDTGNMLKDPISNMPVIVVQKDVMQDILPNKILDNLERIVSGKLEEKIYNEIDNIYKSRFRVIPFSSIGKQNGLLLGIKVDSIEIDFDEENKNMKM